MDLKKIRQQYVKLMPNLHKAVNYVGDQLSDLPTSEFILETNIKPYSSVKRKIISNNYYDVQQLSDLARGRLFFSSEFDMKDVINILKEIFDKNIDQIDNKRHRSEEHGLQYHGIWHVGINCNGINFELQVLPIEFEPFKDFLHQIYEQFRDPKVSDKMSEKTKKFLRQLNNKMYQQLSKLSDDNRMSFNK